jgi:DNA helicase-2/ATP-dependent DNA helicase PcrA
MAKNAFVPSKYQSDIFKFVKSGKGSGIIEALAGSGKSTTIVGALEEIEPGKDTIFLAFNKKIVEELEERIPEGVDCRTTHSLGNSIVATRKVFGRLTHNKNYGILKEMMERGEITKTYMYANSYLITRAISLAKASGIVPFDGEYFGAMDSNNIESWRSLIKEYNLEVDAGSRSNSTESETRSMESFFIDVCQKVLNTSLETKGFDYDDMLYYPVIHSKSLKFPKYDYIFVDEAQDLSKIQLMLIELICKKSSRVIAVGDTYQSIYKFRGSTSNSMNAIKERFNCTSLPLSITYRCPIKVVEEARKFVSHLEAAPNASIGSVMTAESWSVNSFEPGDMVVCRNTAPVIALCYKLISAKIPAQVVGRDIGKGLAGLVRKFNVWTMQELREKLWSWRESEVNKLRKRDEQADTTSIDDRYECLSIFISESKVEKPLDLIREIEDFFKDDDEDSVSSKRVSLSTVHRAKGLEANRVFILAPSLLMPKWAMKDQEQIQQERNIAYVAITRAKETLIYLEPKVIK